jgi:hypothetical protein
MSRAATSAALALAAIVGPAAPGSAQIGPVDGWIGDADGVGVSFVREVDLVKGGRVFLAAVPTSTDPDRVVLRLVGYDPRRAAHSTTSSGTPSTCTTPARGRCASGRITTSSPTTTHG